MAVDPPSQYATDGNLAARQRLWATSRREPAFDLVPWVLGLAGIAAGGRERVLDVGCGNGVYERALEAVGHEGLRVAIDLSAGMLPLVVGAAPLQADVQRVPLATGSVDVVLAPHMLYHVPHIEAAAREVRRVLRPGGVFVAVTNGPDNLGELRSLVETAVGTGWRMVRPADERFSLENGADQLAPAFERVTRVDCPASDVVVTDVDTLADYVASVADHYEPDVGRPWAGIVEQVRQLASATISAESELRLNTTVGAFVCR